MRYLQFLGISVTLLIASCVKMHAPEYNNNYLEEVFMDSAYQLTGVAVTQDQRLFVNYPLWSEKYKYAVIEAFSEDTAKKEKYTFNLPYPDGVYNSWMPGDPAAEKWVCVQSVVVDDQGLLWVVDPAAPKMKNVVSNGQKLVKIDPSHNSVIRSYILNGVTTDTGYINDVRVDTKRQVAYLTNSKEGGIVIVDLVSGKAKQVLTGHYSTKSDPAFRFIIDGRELEKEGKPVKINSDGIALTPAGDWLYYKPLTDDKLYRIQTNYLRDSLSESELESKVEDLGHFTTTDGMIFDDSGNLWMGDMRNYNIVRISPELKMTIVLHDQRLIWPDSYSISNGYLYITCSQIQKQPEYNNGVDKRTTPYAIYRMKLQ